MTDLADRGIIVIDYGSQTTQLVARRLREMGVYAEVVLPRNFDISVHNACGVILSGGPGSVGVTGALGLPAGLLVDGCPVLPVLGICYGMQLLTAAFGGEVAGVEASEFGRMEVHRVGPDCAVSSALFRDNNSETSVVWMSHGDSATVLPEDFEAILVSDNNIVAAVRHRELPVFGVQFHPEVSHTVAGSELLREFALGVCQAEANWRPDCLVTQIVADIKDQVGADGEVILGLSGGVDSLVAGVLLHRALGDRLHCVMVDNGLLRADEVAEVRDIARDVGLNLTVVDARDEFYAALAGISDPEVKRKVIGHKFIDIFAGQQRKLPAVKFLGQGTIYPDVIESAATEQHAVTIKTHHNVGGLPDDLSFELVEPLRDLFKDEVRALGAELGIAPQFLGRHPFPGPGLGVRILGEVKLEFVRVLQAADAIFIRHLREHGVYDEVAQAFCVYLPVNSVAVVGDGRRYAAVIALRAVVTDDFMTATWARLEHELLGAVAREIVNSLPGVSRVVYDITSKPPATIEWE